MATATANLAGLNWTPYASNTADLIAPVVVDLNTYASVSVTPRGTGSNLTAQVQEATGVVVDNMQGTSDLMVTIGPVVEFVPRFQKTVIPLFPSSPIVVFSGIGIIPRVYFYVGTFRGVGSNLNAFASNQAANVASITGGTVDAYLNTLRWKINYQLNNGFNLDNIIDSGFYDVLNPVNSGTSLPAGTYAVFHSQYSASTFYAYQSANNLISASPAIYDRRLVNGVWSPWVLRVAPLGQCLLTCQSGTQLLLLPYQGNQLWIAGALVTIPSAGIALANTGLVGGAFYWCYAAVTVAGVPFLEASQTAPVRDPATGLRVKTGDPSRTLVGAFAMAGAGTPGTFLDTAVNRLVASEFNRRPRVLQSAAVVVSSASTTPVELSATGRVAFVQIGDVATDISVTGLDYTNASVVAQLTYIYVDGGQQGQACYHTQLGGQTAMTVATRAVNVYGEGLHLATIYGAVGGSTGNWNVNLVGSLTQ